MLTTPSEGKQKQLPSLRWRLFVWILFGFLLIVVAPLWTKQSLCPPKEPNIWTIKGQRDSAHDNRDSDEVNNVLIAEQQKAGGNKDNSKGNYLDNLRPPAWLCEETKFTDVLLGFLTYCLVIIGWFGIRSSERSTREMERAYIFGTPQIDKSKEAKDGTTFIEIMLQNYGRTMGTVEIIYGEASATVEPYGDPLYRKGSARAANGALAPTLGKPVRAPVTFECPIGADFYFFGVVTYSDLFRKAHESRFCAKIFQDGSGIEAASTPDFHDWN